MSIEELKKASEEMEAQGKSKEEIAGAYYLMFRDGKINVEQLEALANILGFELSEEFKAMDPEQQKENGYEVINEEITDEGENEEKEAMKLLGQDKKEDNEKVSKDDKDEEEEKAMKFFR